MLSLVGVSGFTEHPDLSTWRRQKYFDNLFVFVVLGFFKDSSPFRIGDRDIRSSAHQSRDEQFVTVDDRVPQSRPTVTVAKVEVTPSLK